MKDLSFIMGIRDLSNAFVDPERYGGKWLKRLTASFMPRITSYGARITDIKQRSPETLLEEFKAVLPGLSKEIKPRYTSLGELVIDERTLIQRLTLPTYMSKLKKDIVHQELLRLGKPINYPSRYLRGKKMSADEYNQYIKKSGTMTRRLLDYFFQTEQYKNMDDEIKILFIDKIVATSRIMPRWTILIKQLKNDLQDMKDISEKKEYLKERGLLKPKIK